MDENINYFRKIFVVEPSHDLSALQKYTDEIVLITTGYEKVSEIYKKVEESLKDFSVEHDAFVPVGKLLATLASGMIISKMFIVPITVGIYKNKDYEFIKIGDILDATQ